MLPHHCSKAKAKATAKAAAKADKNEGKAEKPDVNAPSGAVLVGNKAPRKRKITAKAKPIAVPDVNNDTSGVEAASDQEEDATDGEEDAGEDDLDSAAWMP